MVTPARVAELRAEYFADDIALPPGCEYWDEAKYEAFFASGGQTGSEAFLREAFLPAGSSASAPAHAPPPPLGRPARLLCLHGGGSNATVMEYQVSLFKKTLGATATLDFVEGNRLWNDSDVDPMLRQLFGDSSTGSAYYGWYGVEHDGPPSRPLFELFEDERVQFTYSQVEAALRILEEKISCDGPYDALVAFSQGAILATLHTALTLERQRLHGGPPPSWRRNSLA